MPPTVAANAKIFISGEQVGVMQNLSWDASHGTTPVFGIGSPVFVAAPPGFLRVTGRFEEAYLDNVKTLKHLDTKTISPHTGKVLTTNDFKQLEFNLAVMNAQGNATLETLYNCMLDSESMSLGVGNNIIMHSGTFVAQFKGSPTDLNNVASLLDTIQEGVNLAQQVGL